MYASIYTLLLVIIVASVLELNPFQGNGLNWFTYLRVDNQYLIWLQKEWISTSIYFESIYIFILLSLTVGSNWIKKHTNGMWFSIMSITKEIILQYKKSCWTMKLPVSEDPVQFEPVLIRRNLNFCKECHGSFSSIFCHLDFVHIRQVW